MVKFDSSNVGTAIGTYKYRPGIVYWPDDVWVTREPVKLAESIVQGAIYTKDSDGYLIKPTAASNNVNLAGGIFQAQVTSPAVTGETASDRRIIDCIGATSFIVIHAAANVIPGQFVDLNNDGATASDNDKVKPRTSGTVTASTVGRCLDILELSAARSASVNYDNRARKAKTADGDLVLVRILG